MPVDMAALAADLAAESAVTRALVAGLDEGVGSGWRTPTPAAGWDIADQISHLAYFDEVAVQSAVRPDEFRADLAAAPDSVSLDLGHGHPVDARGLRPGVSGHPLQSADQERRIIDEVEQVTEPAGVVFSRPAVQLGLHLPYLAVLRRLPPGGPRLCPHGTGIPRCVFGHYSSFLD